MFVNRLPVAAAIISSAASAQVVHVPAYPFIGTRADARLGSSVSGAGDINNDGFDDVFVGAPTENNTGGVTTGLARVYSGRSGAFLRTFYGDSAGDQFGWAVSGAGDVNGDGFADVIVGAHLDDNTGTDSGSARVFSGATGAILHTFDGDAADDRFGYSVGGAGDVNGDGFADVIVGAPLNDANGAESGRARVFSGATGAILHTFNGDAAGDRFGWSVGGAGDVNGDGFDDVIVGAPFNDTNGADSGSARVFSGATGAVLYTLNGVGAGNRFGYSVSGAGDVNGDGFADVIVGAPFHSANGANSGSARVFSGADGAVLHTFAGDAVGDNLGFSVSGAGDVNGDGYDDLIVGITLADNNGINSGSARVFCGATGAILYTFNGDLVNDQFGTSVSGAGDVNNDGFDDLIVGAPLADNNNINSGVARVFFSVPSCPPPVAPCPGDADGNRTVNFADITNVLSNFGLACP